MKKTAKKPEKLRLHLALGSNIGDREAYIASALKLLDILPDTNVIAVSDLFIADPVGRNLEGYFMNLVACVETGLSFSDFRKGLFEIELILGKMKSPGSANRTIDIDIIFAGDMAGEYHGLTIPHPLYPKRDFVLMPLTDLDDTLSGDQSKAVHKYLGRKKAPDAPVCLRYKKMVY